jgi:hypothetical protein
MKQCFYKLVSPLSKSLEMHVGGGYHGIKKEFMLYILIPNEKGSPVLTMFPNHNSLYETMLLQTGEPSVKISRNACWRRYCMYLKKNLCFTF